MLLGDSTKQTFHSESKLWEIKPFLHTSLKQVLFRICTNIHHTWYLTIRRIKQTLISFWKVVNIFVSNSVTDITKKSTSNFTCYNWQCYSCEFFSFLQQYKLKCSLFWHKIYWQRMPVHCHSLHLPHINKPSLHVHHNCHVVRGGQKINLCEGIDKVLLKGPKLKVKFWKTKKEGLIWDVQHLIFSLFPVHATDHNKNIFSLVNPFCLCEKPLHFPVPPLTAWKKMHVETIDFPTLPEDSFVLYCSIVLEDK